MAKTLQAIIWGFISICLKFWAFVTNVSKQSNKVGDVLKLEKEELTKLQEALKMEGVLNRNQCINLVNQLQNVVDFLDEMMTKETSRRYEDALKELGRISQKIRVLVEDCVKKEWLRATVYQINNKEAFRELVDDLKCIYEAIFERYLDIYPDLPHSKLSIATLDEIQSDEASMMERLTRLTKRVETMCNDFDDYALAKHLLGLKYDLEEVKGAEMKVMEVPQDVKEPELHNRIGCGASGDVYKSTWLGLESATKKFTCGPNFLKEASILACLRHPNVTKFICCGRVSDTTGDEMMRVPKMAYYLVMELMEMSLSDLLKKQKRPLGYFASINIIHEIAKGMCHLHDMHVAHLDLKPKNVLVSSVSSLKGVERSIGCDYVKLVDYGASQMEVASKRELQEFTVGTRNYMAPEMYNKDKKNVACALEADVWSFAMTCSEILSLKEPFLGTTSLKSIMQKIKGGMRPELPINCKELTMLIEECWVENPSERPTFSSICKRLATLKKKFIVGTHSHDKLVFANAWSTIWQAFVFAKPIGRTQFKATPPMKDDDESTEHEVVVGLESKHAEVRDHLQQTNVLGLIGMGGIGKTTLAKATFHDMRSQYDASCLIENLKSMSSLGILCEILQNLGRVEEKSWILVDAQKVLRDLLSAKKVLIILDDPKDEAQVDDIIPTGIQFVNNGTKIIITTRNWNVIRNRVEAKGKIHVGKLDAIASKELFSSHVSCNRDQLSPHLFDVFDKVVGACDGLPLSLKVMGAFLREKENIRSWEWALERMKRGRLLGGNEEVWSTLRVSFDGLKTDEKNMFLDIACFLPRVMGKERAIHILSNYGTSPINVLDILVNKSLINIDERGDLEMHDQLRDMGQMIVETDKEYLGTRILRKNMIPFEKRAAHEKELKKVEGIYWNEFCFRLPLEDCMGFDDLDLNSLRLLIYTNFETTPKALRNWASLTTLTLCESLTLKTLPEGLKNLTSLITLDLHGCENLTTLPEGLQNLTSLKVLDLNWCKSLTSLPQGLAKLTSLRILDLSWCKCLTTLPEGLGNLASLRTFDLKGCESLARLPVGLVNLTSLKTLDLKGCESLTTVPVALWRFTSLTTLDFSSCGSLTSLPEGLGNLTSLITLDLQGCESLTTLPVELGNLTSLTTLDLSWCKSLNTLPQGLENLSSLRTFNLSRCKCLRTLPRGLKNLISLTTLDLKGCQRLTTLPEGLGNLTSLTTLDLSWCESLVAFPEGLGNLTSLIILDLKGCQRLTTLPRGLVNLTSLTTLDLSWCESLTTLPEGFGNLTSLTTLDLKGCQSLTRLPEGLGNLFSLTTLDLKGCQSLTTLPEGFENLTSLTTLDLSWCESLTTLPEGFGNLTSLTTLDLKGCQSLTRLPEGLGNLFSLTTLDLKGCQSLTTLSEGFENLTSLTTLDLSWCESLTTLPEGFGKLTSLTTLDLKGCQSLTRLPVELGNLTSLTPLDLKGCESLTTLPKGLENLTLWTT